MRVVYFCLLAFVAMPIIAAETTIIVDAEQVWSRNASQIGNLSARIELADSVTQNTAFTMIVRAQAFSSDQHYPGQPDQAELSPVSRRIYVDSFVELELREFYFDTGFEKANLRLGKQQVVWGQADGLKLLDVVNPQDFSLFILDDFDESRIPIWMLNLELFLPVGDLQILWIPDTSTHSLASTGATFEMTAPFAGIPADLPYSIEPVDRPNNFIFDSDFGTRLSLFTGGWDITLNYLYHYDDFPVVRRQLVANELILSPAYERTHTIGASASNAFGDFIFRSEFVFNTNKYINTNSLLNDGIDDSAELAYVFGIDWTGLTDTFVSMQLFQSILLDDGDYVRDRTDTTLTLLLRRSFMNEVLKLELLAIHHQNEGDNLFRLSADYEMTSNTSIGVFGDFFDGEPNELFGQFNHMDRIGFKITVGI